MRKKLIIIIVFILLLISLSLYYTYAIDVTIEEVTSSNADLTFNINIEENSSRTISVKAGQTKYFDIFITNTNDGTINYGLAYDNVEIEGITIAQVNTSKNKVSELIEGNTTHQINMVIVNETTSDYTYDIKPIVGYEKGGDLIVPTGYTKIEDVYEIPNEPNKPALVDGLIPITYSDNKWVKANYKNTDYNWYNYKEKRWANAVLVSSDYRNSDGTDKFNIGDEVPEDAILAYYVWIPRYKYKVFNINKTIGVDSYKAETKGIDIMFEKGKETTGTISCEYDFTVLEGEGLSETCSGNNGDYYTHPAFTFGDDELTGIWVGKFEISSSDPSKLYGGGGSTSLSVRIKPNVNSWRYNHLSNVSYVIQNMQKDNNDYGLSIDKTIADSHMIKNMEWGSIAYLAHSEYGRCSNNECVEVEKNDSSEYITGGNDYVTNIVQSTTGNIYGIYDMSGGTDEYVMGNMSSMNGSYQYYASLAGSNFTYSSDTEKYLDTYAYGEEYYRQIAFNRSRLGDATGEVVKDVNHSWNDDRAFFIYSSFSWFYRGGADNSSLSGIFTFKRDDGQNGRLTITSRAILVSLK